MRAEEYQLTVLSRAVGRQVQSKCALFRTLLYILRALRGPQERPTPSSSIPGLGDDIPFPLRHGSMGDEGRNMPPQRVRAPVSLACARAGSFLRLVRPRAVLLTSSDHRRYFWWSMCMAVWLSSYDYYYTCTSPRRCTTRQVRSLPVPCSVINILPHQGSWARLERGPKEDEDDSLDLSARLRQS